MIFSNLLRLLKNGQKSDSFAAHFKQNFNTTASHTDLRKYTAFKVVNKLNPIGAMKKFKNLIVIYVWRDVLRSSKRYVTNASRS